MGRRKTELTVSRTIEMFLDMLAAERGAAVNTLESYRRDLANFTAFTMVRKRDPEKADTPMIRKYFTQLSSRGMAPGTSAQHLSALRQFFKFLVSEGLREDNPCTTIDSPRLGRPLPKYLNEAEVETLLETANGHGGPEGFACAPCSKFYMRPVCGFRVGWHAHDRFNAGRSNAGHSRQGR